MEFIQWLFIIIIGCQTKSDASERKRSKIYFQLRDELKAKVTENTLKAILDFNKQFIPDDYSDVSQSMNFSTIRPYVSSSSFFSQRCNF